jgi:hypothetical protein
MVVLVLVSGPTRNRLAYDLPTPHYVGLVSSTCTGTYSLVDRVPEYRYRVLVLVLDTYLLLISTYVYSYSVLLISIFIYIVMNIMPMTMTYQHEMTS